MKRLKDINWNQVYYFHEVARAGSMTLAAQAIGVSLPTVSEQIKKLEELLEIELFRRSSRRIELTSGGWDLYHCSREMFAAGIRFLDKVSPSSIGGYAARVGIQETIADALSLDFLYRYEQAFSPFGSVRLQREQEAENVLQRLLRGELDWGISSESPRQARLDCREIGSLDIAFCCSKEVWDRFAGGENVLRSLPLARSICDKTLNQKILMHLKTLGIMPEEIIESDFPKFALGLARRGRCVAPVVLHTDVDDDALNGMHVFSLGEPIGIQLFAVWAKTNERMIAIKEMCSLLPGTKTSSEIPSTQLEPVLSVPTPVTECSRSR